jgi:hypothetical protein
MAPVDDTVTANTKHQSTKMTLADGFIVAILIQTANSTRLFFRTQQGPTRLRLLLTHPASGV